MAAKTGASVLIVFLVFATAQAQEKKADDADAKDKKGAMMQQQGGMGAMCM